MKLTELKARFIGAGGEGIFNVSANGERTPAPERRGIGVMLDCPCGKCGVDLYVPFHNPLDGGPPVDLHGAKWNREGDTIETLTLSPSILRTVEKGGCGWHGFIRNGEAVL